MRIRTFFPDFKLCRPVISKPVVLEKSDIPQKKALNSGNWKQFWNWKDFCHGRLQTGFSKSDAFSVRWAWPSIGWCHAHFFSWFKELYIRAFQWYIICFRILVGTCSKLQYSNLVWPRVPFVLDLAVHNGIHTTRYFNCKNSPSGEMERYSLSFFMTHIEKLQAERKFWYRYSQ